MISGKGSSPLLMLLDSAIWYGMVWYAYNDASPYGPLLLLGLPDE